MKNRLRTLFGVDASGKPTMPNSRRQLAVGGAICLLLWPGIGLALLLAGELDPGERKYAIISPWLVVTLLGIYLLGQSLLATRERKKFDSTKKHVK